MKPQTALIMLACPLLVSGQANQYIVQDISNSTAPVAVACDLNSRGHFVWAGASSDQGYYGWSADTGVTHYTFTNGARLIPWSLKDDDTIAGSIRLPNGGSARTGVVLPLGGSLTIYNSPWFINTIYDVNVNGIAVGRTNDLIEGETSYWTSPTSRQVLPNPSSGSFQGARFINNNGDILGFGEGGTYRWRLSEPTSYQILQVPGFTGQTSPVGMMADGGSVGGYFDGELFHTVRWNASGGLIGILDNFSCGDINDLGLLVGSRGATDAQRATIWTPTSGFTELDSLLGTDSGYHLTYAHKTNLSGQILASGTKNGSPVTVLLTPVPEPSSFAALMIGLGALLKFRRASN